MAPAFCAAALASIHLVRRYVVFPCYASTRRGGRHSHLCGEELVLAANVCKEGHLDAVRLQGKKDIKLAKQLAMHESV